MHIFTALIYIFIGGVINGSFALPTKNIRHWSFENIWLNYALWAFLILPWASIFLLAPEVGIVYKQLSLNLLVILIIGGLLFGVGQACFAQSLKMIGFGLGFVINIGLGTALGFLLPLIVFNPGKIFTAFGLVTLIGSLLIITGLIISYRAGKQREMCTQQTRPHSSSPPNQYLQGVVLAMAAGFCSAMQNFTFAATHSLQTLALQAGINHLASAMIIWPVFLTFTFFPYGFYMMYLHQKNQSFVHYKSSSSRINLLMTLIMALCWYSSLILYSQASLLIGNLGPVVGWPLFMVLIILAANFWGWRHREWAGVTPSITRQALLAIGLLILAVIVLAFSASLSSN